MWRLPERRRQQVHPPHDIFRPAGEWAPGCVCGVNNEQPGFSFHQLGLGDQIQAVRLGGNFATEDLPGQPVLTDLGTGTTLDFCTCGRWANAAR